ncbi:MAG: alpha amylase C-terminal domain-containing protein [Saprospiraceae bacterium]
MNEKFANLRLLYGYMFTHSGTKLLFMGGEFAQTSEWSETKGLDWHLLEHGNHKNIQRLVSDLNALYKNKPALHQMQFQPEGFEWIDLQDYENSVLVYLRKGEKGEKPLVICCNFTPVERDNYTIGLPFNAKWTEVFNTDAAIYGGTDARNEAIKVVKKKYHNLDYSCALTLPPLSMICLEPDKVPSSWPKVKKAAVKKPASKKTVTKKSRLKRKSGNLLFPSRIGFHDDGFVGDLGVRCESHLHPMRAPDPARFLLPPGFLPVPYQ